MELQWMGEYRDYVEKMIKFGNAYANLYQKEQYYNYEVEFSPSQLQVLEYLLETEEKQQNMAEIAARLGVSPSSFSRNVKKMINKGLLEKYHTVSNRKNIIVRVSDRGREAYAAYSDYVLTYRFRQVFSELDKIPKESLAQITHATDVWAEQLLKDLPGRKEEKAEELVRIE